MLPRFFVTSMVYFVTITANAQFPPPAGVVGTTAIAADSSIFVAWATGIELQRGYEDIAADDLVEASNGAAELALGAPDDPSIVSLGDGGVATLTFDKPIRNGEGFDFAVFENSFDGAFLELAFVEVSSDGENFVRFPATSNTSIDAPIGTFGWIDATKINNLAGKYISYFGTPFDLEELKDSSLVDVNAITHVRLIDVVGSLDAPFATFDQNGHPINDPYPTPFPSSGFDLDAVGVIHEFDPSPTSVSSTAFTVAVYPNPIRVGELPNIRCSTHETAFAVAVFGMQGQYLGKQNSIPFLEKGISFFKTTHKQGFSIEKLTIH